MDDWTFPLFFLLENTVVLVLWLLLVICALNVAVVPWWVWRRSHRVVFTKAMLDSLPREP